MRTISRFFLFGTLVLVLLTTACGAEGGQTPSPVGTIFPGDLATPTLGAPNTTQTAGTETATTAETPTGGLETPTVSGTESVSTQATSIVGSPAVTQTPGIPVTGVDIVLVECQFCVDTIAHALLVLPDTATFKVVSVPTTSTTAESITTACSTIEVNNGRQVVLCNGPEMTPITLNICTANGACTDFPVDLQACPLNQSGTAIPKETQSTPETGSATPTPAILSTPSVTPTP